MTPKFAAPTGAAPERARGLALGGLLLALGLAAAGSGCDMDDRRSPVLEDRQAAIVQLAPQARIRIETRSADVRLVASPDDSVRVVTSKRVQSMSARSAEAMLKQIRVTMERSGDQLVLRVREPERGSRRVTVQAGPWRVRRSVEIQLTVAVPHGVAVDYQTERGDLVAEGIDLPLTLQSTSGDMDISNHHASLNVRTTSGDVVIREATGSVTVQATSGDVSAIGVTGPVTVRATSGDVEATNVSGVVRIETSSGDVEALDLKAGAHVSTSTGDASVRAGGDSLIIETATGDIDSRALNAPVLTSLRSSSGDILLKFPLNVGGRLEVQTATGGMHVQIPLQVESMDRNRLIGRLGGTGQVLLRTSSGDITIRPSEVKE